MFLLDTNILMSVENFDNLFNEFGDGIYISAETLQELDHLKTAPEAKGFRARRAVRNVEKHWNELHFVSKSERYYRKLDRKVTSMDDIIISYMREPGFAKAELITNDVAMKLKAMSAGVPTNKYKEIVAARESVMTVNMNDDDFAEFSETLANLFDRIPGEYLIVRDLSFEKAIRVILKYNGGTDWDVIDEEVGIKNYLCNIKALDEYQRCAIDSLINDDFTVVSGPAGTGKTLLCLSHALGVTEKHGSKLHVFVNPVKVRGSEELGYYPGSRDEKLLQNFIGDILKNKAGDMDEIYRLLSTGALNIYPMSDIRGIEIPAGDIMYITEGQNLSIDLIKLAIQRPAEGAKIIIEGDPYTQVDKSYFEGELNGLRRVIDVYAGFDGFGHVYLPNIHRSKIADKAEEL